MTVKPTAYQRGALSNHKPRFIPGKRSARDRFGTATRAVHRFASEIPVPIVATDQKERQAPAGAALLQVSPEQRSLLIIKKPGKNEKECDRGLMPSASYYRAKAAECMALAEVMSSQEAARTLRLLARDYLDLAEICQEDESNVADADGERRH